MVDFCTCADWKALKERHDIFSYDEVYGWVIQWIELTKEGETSSLVNKYGISIKFCPMCGKPLDK